MFLDLNPDRSWDEPMACKSCKRPILAEHATDEVQMPFDGEHRLHELNGAYHAECAKPYLSLMRALALTRRPLF